MDDETEEYGFVVEDEADMPSFPFSWRFTASVASNYAATVLRATANFAADVSTQLAADHNYRIDQRTFHEAAALEIEKMTQGE